MGRRKENTIKVSHMLDQGTLDRVDALARHEQRSRSKQVNVLLGEALRWREMQAQQSQGSPS